MSENTKNSQSSQFFKISEVHEVNKDGEPLVTERGVISGDTKNEACGIGVSCSCFGEHDCRCDDDTLEKDDTGPSERPTFKI